MTERERQAGMAPSGFFGLRTPLLPFDELLAWGAGLGAVGALAERARLEAALAADRALLRDRLRALLARPEVREAVFVASPDLEESLVFWQQAPESERGQKVERALVRYVVRMVGRATPFGLFAGCSLGTLGPQSRLALVEQARYQRHTRLDMDYLFALTEALGRQPELRHTVVYRPNSSLYRAAGRVRYAEARLRDKERSYHLVAVESNDYLDATLDRARQGASAASLAAALVEADPEISREEADGFIGELIDNQLLVSDLSPAVTGPEPVHDLVDQCRRQPAAGHVADRLEQGLTALADIDGAGLGVEPERYRAVARLFDDLPAKAELARLFQVDLVKPMTAATLGPAVLEEIVRGVHLLRQQARRPSPSDKLARFREAFENRYQTQEVPLVEALDEEVGVGFDAATAPGAEAGPLLEGISLVPVGPGPTVPLEARHAVLVRKFEEARRQGAQEMVLEPDDLEALRSNDPPPLPAAFAVTALVAAASEDALDRGEFRVLLGGAVGPSGARLLGRFCHADAALRRHVEQHLRAEEALEPGAVFAEVVHLPEGRIGNVLCRPVLRSYEIPYLGRSGAAAEQQIPITDLLVSVPAGQIILRSARLGCRVFPRLSSAHNYAFRSLGVYKFLCELQGQGVTTGLGWDWGVLNGAAFLPRVVTGRLVLARARWLVAQKELRSLAGARGAARFQAVQAWRAERRLPRFVLLSDGDNELPIDLENVLSVETWIDLIKGRDQAVLVEMYPGPEQLWTHSPEGRFVHELVIPFVRTPEDAARPEPSVVRTLETRSTPLTQPSGVRRAYPPGSEWLFAKFYTGSATADQVLRDLIGPIAQSALRSGAADRWFFIRYGDPDWHLRLRCHGAPERLHAEVLPTLLAAAAPLLDDGRIWRVQLDTYEPEIERYGGAEGVVLAERLFHADSEAVLAIVELLTGDAGTDARWRLTLRGIAMLLADLGLSPDVQHAVLKSAGESFAGEFRIDADLKRQLGAKFRQERASLEALLDANRDAESPLAPGFAALRRRSALLAPVVADLRACARAGRLALPLEILAASYIHMHANRLLRSAHRAQELVLYNFLHRLHESRARRGSGS
jgi:thiopeptide-type bacteriocin biosynthesis protein